MSQNRTHVDLELLRSELAPLSIKERAKLLEGVVDAFYEVSKFYNPGGEGPEGTDGPERTSLAKVRDAALDYSTYALKVTSQQ